MIIFYNSYSDSYSGSTSHETTSEFSFTLQSESSTPNWSQQHQQHQRLEVKDLNHSRVIEEDVPNQNLNIINPIEQTPHLNLGLDFGDNFFSLSPQGSESSSYVSTIIDEMKESQKLGKQLKELIPQIQRVGEEKELLASKLKILEEENINLISRLDLKERHEEKIKQELEMLRDRLKELNQKQIFLLPNFSSLSNRIPQLPFELENENQNQNEKDEKSLSSILNVDLNGIFNFFFFFFFFFNK